MHHSCSINNLDISIPGRHLQAVIQVESKQKDSISFKMRKKFDKTDYDGEVKLENRGYRAETNQHKEMEMSEIISETLNRLCTGLLLRIKNMSYKLQGLQDEQHNMSLFTKNLINLWGRIYLSS